jgi:hypothetical protein
MRLQEDIDELYRLYITTPEGENIKQLLYKIDRYCKDWMHEILIEKLRRELLVQLIEKDFVDDKDYYKDSSST